MASFTNAIAVKALDSHSYSADFSEQWCIGSGKSLPEIPRTSGFQILIFKRAVPHGGFVTSVFLNVVRTHFSTTLSKQNQPHTISLHLEFLRRTSAGSVQFTVEDTKLGRQTSTVHVTLKQRDRVEVVGYISNSNMHTETGLTLPTKWELHPPPPTVNLPKLKADTDPNWALQTNMPFAPFRKASQNVKFYFPRQDQLLKSIADEWLCFANGERFTNESLGYVSDMWPQVVEAYRAEKDPYHVDKAQPAPTNQDQNQHQSKSKSKVVPARFWYPTLLLNLDIKKFLPAEGVEWLFVRVRAKQIRNGRMDLECIIFDEGGDLVALSHHVGMILGVERNMAERRPGDGGSKI
ncbi:hypothetical protein MMC16_004991 [Acarospora aff. strigata]|nr:hypothetical protein [Acarospora aff. strigata]